MTQDMEVKLATTATLMAIFWQERASYQLMKELRDTRHSLAGILPRMRHTKTQEPLTHE